MEISNQFPSVFEDNLNDIEEADRESVGRKLSDVRANQIDVNPIKGNFDIEHLAKIHKHLFQDSSSHAGVVRGYGLNKGSSSFATPEQMPYLFDKELPERIKALEQSIGNEERYTEGLSDLHSTLDLAHPFREGNGRSARAFMSQLSKEHGYEMDFSKLNKEEWVKACISSINTGREDLKQPLFLKITTRTLEKEAAKTEKKDESREHILARYGEKFVTSMDAKLDKENTSKENRSTIWEALKSEDIGRAKKQNIAQKRNEDLER